MRIQGAMATGLIAALFAATAASAQTPPRTDDSGLRLTGPSTPEVLKADKADPYRPPARRTCRAIALEIAELDAALGFTPGAPARKDRDKTSEFLGDAARTLVPYRGVVRLVTGAGRKEREWTDAAMAGATRRGYLRGLQTSMRCAVPRTSPAAAQVGDRRAAADARKPAAR